MKLNPDFKAKWVAALRSGDYKQAHHSLVAWGPTLEHGPRAFCCLGVGCLVSGVDPKELRNLDVPARSHVDGWWDGDGGPYPSPHDPWVLVNGVECKLSEVNDNLKLNFAQIADIIEQQL
jgi:hypothetical protein